MSDRGVISRTEGVCVCVSYVCVCVSYVCVWVCVFVCVCERETLTFKTPFENNSNNLYWSISPVEKKQVKSLMVTIPSLRHHFPLNWTGPSSLFAGRERNPTIQKTAHKKSCLLRVILCVGSWTLQAGYGSLNSSIWSVELSSSPLGKIVYMYVDIQTVTHTHSLTHTLSPSSLLSASVLPALFHTHTLISHYPIIPPPSPSCLHCRFSLSPSHTLSPSLFLFLSLPPISSSFLPLTPSPPPPVFSALSLLLCGERSWWLPVVPLSWHHEMMSSDSPLASLCGK